MKLPLLILSLVVVFWSCAIYADEDIDSTGDIIDLDEKYGLDYQYAPLDKSLSRYKRGLITTPIKNVITTIFGKSAGILLQPVLEIYNTLIGNNACPKVEKLSLELLPRLLNPLETINVIKIVVCNILDLAGSAGRAVISKGVQAAVQFTTKILIPGLHTVLIRLRDTGVLPPSIVMAINTFDTSYKLLKLLGYVG